MIQPIPGYFASPQRWQSASIKQRAIATIRAVAQNHAHWPLSSISAAAVLGAMCNNADLYRFIHFSVDIHTSTQNRKRLPVRFHYIKTGRSPKIRFLLSDEKSTSTRNTYIPISETLGMINGFIVTSPLQTIFDCMRMLPFEDALIICDKLAKRYNITYNQIVQFTVKRSGCWKVRYAAFKQRFIDPQSENGGESFCRARMLRSGFTQPELQVELPNPLFKIKRPNRYDIQNSKTIRPDFLWKISDENATFKYIAAELDGKEKYSKPSLIVNSHSTSTQGVILKEKDRETALNLAGYKVIRFQFFEAAQSDGAAMSEKLLLAGVPR
ncbi:hypothetical protein EJ419_06130 [Alloscardovia theropitheci]|uniref:DUF559 domain-containing protein n=1 Tax=Alloscardovia theropitheci TaxID=2496842 RepID=A0A4R0QP67_9BIFI|nr:hypothetical protein [Alloscardovia theropitheci]TCD54003.1 hypothetical protein EJ419_06130 [Alloscardovia theropitheci]